MSEPIKKEESKAIMVPTLASGMPFLPTQYENDYNSQQAKMGGLAKVALDAALQNLPEPERIAICACKITIGREVGIPTGAALMHIKYINGNFGADAQIIWGIIIAYKKRVETDIDFKIIEWSEKACIIDVKRPSLYGTEAVRFTWTIEMAKKAGLDNNAKKEKNPWVYDPKSMLWSRNATQIGRRMFPDVIGGLAYSPEEIQDFELKPETKKPVSSIGGVEIKSEVKSEPKIEEKKKEESKITDAEIVSEPKKEEPKSDVAPPQQLHQRKGVPKPPSMKATSKADAVEQAKAEIKTDPTPEQLAKSKAELDKLKQEAGKSPEEITQDDMDEALAKAEAEEKAKKEGK